MNRRRRLDRPIWSSRRTYRFDIPAGPLDQAVHAFERVTGVVVEAPSVSPIAVFASPGVRGVFTAAEALDALLAGTGLACRFTGENAATFDVHLPPDARSASCRAIS